MQIIRSDRQLEGCDLSFVLQLESIAMQTLLVYVIRFKKHSQVNNHNTGISEKYEITFIVCIEIKLGMLLVFCF